MYVILLLELKYSQLIYLKLVEIMDLKRFLPDHIWELLIQCNFNWFPINLDQLCHKPPKTFYILQYIISYISPVNRYNLLDMYWFYLPKSIYPRKFQILLSFEKCMSCHDKNQCALHMCMLFVYLLPWGTALTWVGDSFMRQGSNFCDPAIYRC